MGVQMRKLFTAGCFNGNVSDFSQYPQFRTLQNMYSAFPLYMPFGSGRKCGKCFPLKISRPGKFSSSNKVQLMSNVQAMLAVPGTVKIGSFFVPGYLEFILSPHEMMYKRLFSSNAINGAKFRGSHQRQQTSVIVKLAKASDVVSTEEKSSKSGRKTVKKGATIEKSNRSSREKSFSSSGEGHDEQSVQITVNKVPSQRSKKSDEKIAAEVEVPLLVVNEKEISKPLIKRKTLKKASLTDKSKLVSVGEAKCDQMKKMRPLYPPSGKSVVVVESVTKAKMIQGYLGDMYEVLPSYGHVRDLAGRSGSVRPDDDFSMVWEVPSAAWTHLKSIKVALNGARNLILASDPDREGEAIAWHIIEMLQQQDAINDDIDVARVVFYEITESAIKSALGSPRNIDINLVHAYLARRALDYLIGFNISPLLWRKLPGCQSAGRVQSAALALICDRESEIEAFVPKEFWTVEVDFHKPDLGLMDKGFRLSSQMIHFNSRKLEKFSICSHEEAKIIEQNIQNSKFEVSTVKQSKIHKSPPAPYITSTLQQDASSKLHFSAGYTMKLAQKLYEGVRLSNDEATGLITYMRTDGLHISDGAVTDIRSLVTERYGAEFASKSTRTYHKKVKNAQEAHEAIRPTDIRRLPSMLSGTLDEDSMKLYTLIWSRTMACQMEQATFDRIQINIKNSTSSIMFRATSTKVGFPGYQAAYKDDEVLCSGEDKIDSITHDDVFNAFASLEASDKLHIGTVKLKQHFSEPPPRYSEGSLVRKLEELGIGRPSTYAPIMRVLQDRNYVAVKNRVLVPEFRGRMVSAFLSVHFSEVTDHSFTADMENELDNVSSGKTEWKGLLKDYWVRVKADCDHASKLDVRQVEKMLEGTFGDFLFASIPDKSRLCPSCLEGTLTFKVSRFGAGYFIGCNQHPKCKYIASTIFSETEEGGVDVIRTDRSFDPKLLGHHPVSNEKVYLKKGPYGFYFQLGDDRKDFAPKRVSVKGAANEDSLTLDDALDLLRYPVPLGNHPDDGQPVELRISKVGFTIRHRACRVSLPKNIEPQNLTLEKAIKLLSSKAARHSGRPKRKPQNEEEEN